MIFEIYLQSDSDCKLAGVPKQFKTRLESGDQLRNALAHTLLKIEIYNHFEAIYVFGKKASKNLS